MLCFIFGVKIYGRRVKLTFIYFIVLGELILLELEHSIVFNCTHVIKGKFVLSLKK